MQEVSSITGGVLSMRNHVQKTRRGKIRTAAISKSSLAIRSVLMALIALTALSLLTFDYKDIRLGEALASTWQNVTVVFAQPRLTYGTAMNVLYQLLVTFCLGILSTIFGALIAFFGALLCAKNIARPGVAAVIKSIVALIRAVPTILWVLIFAVSAGLGSVAAVAGLTFHSAGYLIKAYAESIEEMDDGVIEALRASGAGFWQIVFQAVVPSSISYMLA